MENLNNYLSSKLYVIYRQDSSKKYVGSSKYNCFDKINDEGVVYYNSRKEAEEMMHSWGPHHIFYKIEEF